MNTYNELYIDGKWVKPSTGATIANIDPSNESVITDIANASVEDAEAAIKAAREAFDNGSWSGLTGSQRAKYLRAIAKEIRDNLDFLAQLEVQDNGKPFTEAQLDMNGVIDCFEFYANLAEDFDNNQESEIEIHSEGYSCLVRKEPLGVVSAIIPWNFPLDMAAWKVAPALAAGCTMVLKPAEVTSMTAIELGRICQKVGLPNGVLNIVTGHGSKIGPILCEHPAVDKVAFTGSGPVGKQIMRSAANTVKKISLELGGKSPLIIFDDVDIETAVEWIMFGIFWNQGQVCSATSRVLVQDGIYDELTARLVQEAEKIVIGNGMDKGVQLGPVVNKKQYDAVMTTLEKGKSDGVNVLTGGKRASGFDKGYFIEPTVFGDVPEDHPIWTDEIFGPVVALRRFTDEAEAVASANNSELGLAAGVISKDIDRANRVARNLQAGIIWVNCSQPLFLQAPWGGYKQSGIGRELGTWGLDNYLETKQITTYHSEAPLGWYLT